MNALSSYSLDCFLEILSDCLDLEHKDILAVFAYAAQLAKTRWFYPIGA